MKNIVEVIIGFNVNTEEIAYIKSDFESPDLGYKDPVQYTISLLQMAYEKYLREKIGILCPNCEIEMQEGWSFCPNCGWGDK